MSKPVRIVMSAIRGYGFYYLKTIFEEIPGSDVKVVGVIAPHPEKSAHYPELLARGIPSYPDMDLFFKDGGKADLTVISSPIQYHVPQAISALKNGSHVLMDKPMCATAAEAEELIRVKNETGLFVEVGYQWSFSEAIQNLKSDILSGLFGLPLRAKTICLWPRDNAYYGRNNWAGKIRSVDGLPVYDSPANNASAHHLHNLLFLLGDRMDRSARPERVTGVRYRVYDIENYDTVSMRVATLSGPEIFYYSSHAIETARNPEFVIECEKARIALAPETGIVAAWDDGRTKNYGHPDADHQFKKLFRCIASLNEHYPDICPPEAAISQTICIEKLQHSPIEIATFPGELVVIEPERRWVKGLGEKMGKAYERWEIVTSD
ncbi:MAG: Gfo/Idh/MocA family oxidoreductase [Bacteroidota bacterium]